MLFNLKNPKLNKKKKKKTLKKPINQGFDIDLFFKV